MLVGPALIPLRPFLLSVDLSVQDSWADTSVDNLSTGNDWPVCVPEIHFQEVQVMYDAKIVGERIKELRKNKGLTQSQVAEILCISDKSTVSKIENGIKPLSIDNAITLATLFGVSLDYLLRGERFKNNNIISALECVPEEYSDVAEKMILAALSSLKK